jgi:3D (Asp-Asp-Asp) domain-containing protein
MTMFRTMLGWKNAWRIRIVALGFIVLAVGGGSQILVNSLASGPDMITLKVTAYTTSGRMADGNITYPGACAVSSTQFSLGTVLALYNLDGTFNRQCTVEDTRSSLSYGHIELAMPGNTAGAMNWGVRYLNVQVLRLGWDKSGPSVPTASSNQLATSANLHKLKPWTSRHKARP